MTAKHALDNPILAEHAAEIRRLGKRVVEDVVEIGRRLTECKKLVGHGNWLPWIDREFGWTDKTAENFINVHKLAGKFENFSNLELPLSGLYLLAAPSTSKEARDKIIERARAGESLPVAEVKRVVERHKGTKHREQPTKQKLPAPKSKKPPPLPAPTPARDDTGVTSADKNERLSAQVDKLQDQKRKLEIENLALKSEVDDLKSKSSNADEAVREKTRGPRPPPNEMLVRLSAFLAGCGPSGERFVREALIEHAKQIIASGVGDIETARRVLEKFTQREVAR